MEITVSAREWQAPNTIFSYEQIVDAWNDLKGDADVRIIHAPGVEFEGAKEPKRGLLFPREFIEILEGTSSSVNPQHVA